MNRDMRYDRADGRNPYGSRGGYVTSRRSRRGRRGDRGMDYGMNDMRRGDMRDMRRNYDMGDYRQDMAMQDGHYPQHRQGGYEPVEFMGYCSGYYGSPEDYGDMARGGRGRGRDRGDMRDYGDMGDYGRGGRVGYPREMEQDYARYGRDYGDYGDYRDYGDYGETLSEEELEKWCKKLKGQLDESEKQMFSKEMISQRAKQMGKPMEGFGEKELETTVLMLYDDYKATIGKNLDIAIKLAFDWLNDKDASVKGAEKLAVYYDNIVEPEE